jgi:hypothetical protein
MGVHEPLRGTPGCRPLSHIRRIIANRSARGARRREIAGSATNPATETTTPQDRVGVQVVGIVILSPMSARPHRYGSARNRLPNIQSFV